MAASRRPLLGLLVVILAGWGAAGWLTAAWNMRGSASAPVSTEPAWRLDAYMLAGGAVVQADQRLHLALGHLESLAPAGPLLENLAAGDVAILVGVQPFTDMRVGSTLTRALSC